MKTITEDNVRGILANNLKHLRGLQNISQMDLAIKAGLTHNFINDIENSRKWISPKTLAKLASALAVEPFQLFLSDPDSEDPLASYVKDFQDKFQKIVKELTNQYVPKKTKPKKKY